MFVLRFVLLFLSRFAYRVWNKTLFGPCPCHVSPLLSPVHSSPCLLLVPYDFSRKCSSLKNPLPSSPSQTKQSPSLLTPSPSCLLHWHSCPTVFFFFFFFLFCFHRFSFLRVIFCFCGPALFLEERWFLQGREGEIQRRCAKTNKLADRQAVRGVNFQRQTPSPIPNCSSNSFKQTYNT
ncbi:hypothetical protein F5H01DRAFT_138611 [Linnemannia elongata]|nr:hypothetical protein F5H01DRAFT_138611 [Linnemannia elongata]